jgi:hypothetical protein
MNDTDILPSDAPSITDLVVMLVTWGVTSLLKRFVKNQAFADTVRRFLPLFSVLLGVAIQVAIHAAAGGASWGQAIVKGVYTGASAVAAHNLYKATVRGELSVKAPPPDQVP